MLRNRLIALVFLCGFVPFTHELLAAPRSIRYIFYDEIGKPAANTIRVFEKEDGTWMLMLENHVFDINRSTDGSSFVVKRLGDQNSLYAWQSRGRTIRFRDIGYETETFQSLLDMYLKLSDPSKPQAAELTDLQIDFADAAAQRYVAYSRRPPIGSHMSEESQNNPALRIGAQYSLGLMASWATLIPVVKYYPELGVHYYHALYGIAAAYIVGRFGFDWLQFHESPLWTIRPLKPFRPYAPFVMGYLAASSPMICMGVMKLLSR